MAALVRSFVSCLVRNRDNVKVTSRPACDYSTHSSPPFCREEVYLTRLGGGGGGGGGGYRLVA